MIFEIICSVIIIIIFIIIRTKMYEIICIEVQDLRSEPFNIISWYRPPNAPIDSFEQLDRVLGYIDREGKEAILLEDINYTACST